MNRFKLYTILFVINLVISALGFLLKLQDQVGVINFICFIVSVLYFLFNVEEPPKTSKLKIPEVHNYYRSRQNHFGNIVAIEFAILSFLFFILLYSTQIPLFITVLMLWGISVPVTYLIIVKTSRNHEFNKIVDYIHFVYPELKLSLIESVVKGFVKTNTLDKDSIMLSCKGDSALLSNLADAYIDYVNSIGLTLTQGEIQAINDL